MLIKGENCITMAKLRQSYCYVQSGGGTFALPDNREGGANNVLLKKCVVTLSELICSTVKMFSFIN